MDWLARALVVIADNGSLGLQGQQVILLYALEPACDSGADQGQPPGDLSGGGAVIAAKLGGGIPPLRTDTPRRRTRRSTRCPAPRALQSDIKPATCKRSTLGSRGQGQWLRLSPRLHCALQ